MHSFKPVVTFILFYNEKDKETGEARKNNREQNYYQRIHIF